jgi:hypothetical protein
MNHPEESYPLAWPVGWPRSRHVQSSKFGDYSLYKARQQLERELRLLGAQKIILSSNIALRLDGLPYSGAREPADHGAAVYFRVGGEQRVLACDHNVVAIARHVEAIRGQLRWGVGSVEQAFAGYKALPPVANGPRSCWEILGLAPLSTVDQIAARRRELMRSAHPDAGGDPTLAAEINRAADEAERLASA